ncbi:MAG TPA: hypothetical protein VK400_00265, partial [Pyrinomonadaceae bacterium]|nr:hypothetical protein [Pyrinomonadaceae bacterium]
MKRFIISVLCVSVFFTGLGSLIENVGAKFKSDERALELLRQARQAIGGEQLIAGVRSLSATGRTTKIFHIEGEQPKTEQGDWELNMQLPDKFSRKMMLRREGGKGETVENEVFVIRRSGDAKERISLPNPGGAEQGGEKKRVAFI